MTLERRTFLKKTLLAAGAVASGPGIKNSSAFVTRGTSSGSSAFATRGTSSDSSAFATVADSLTGPPSSKTFEFPRKKARHWTKLTEKKIRCELCPRKCVVANMERGFCGVRENNDGDYFTLVWGRACTAHIDPIEKKPLFHFLPGSQALSIATAGCNMECKFCQNWELSQFRPEQLQAYYLPPKKLVQTAINVKTPTIACTYNEPVIFFEYMYDCAVEGKKQGINTVMISNGFIQEKPMRELCKVLTAIKIDLKSFTNDFYKNYTKSEIKPVLDTLKLLAKEKKWFEVVVLLIPTLNDGEKEITELCKWIAGELGKNVPLHFSRFYPTFKLKNLPPTPPRTLEKAYEIGVKAGLNYVYLGNIPGNRAESTFCPHCKKRIITRYGYRISDLKIKNGKCSFCGEHIPGIWK